jgi:hypothetical protein
MHDQSQRWTGDLVRALRQTPERQGRLYRALRQLLQGLGNPKHHQQRRRALQHDPAKPLHLRHQRLLPAAGAGKATPACSG